MATQNYIIIKNAQTHNLKGIDVKIPHKKLVVITGLSGSGKTSLAYDTLYAEGHRRYIESLSSYARQFVERLPKPPVDYIKGLSPCIALEQKVSTNNPRSTVGTATEIYDYLRVLFARVGSIYHPVTGQEIKRHFPQDVVEFILKLEKDLNIFIGIKIEVHNKLYETLSSLSESGFSRVLINQDIFKINDIVNQLPKKIDHCFLIIDRINIENVDEDLISRITDSVETAYHQSNGICYVITQKENNWHFHKFTNVLEADGISFEEPSPQLFAFNNPYGICQTCKGTGRIWDFDFDKVFTNPSLKVNQTLNKKTIFNKEDVKYIEENYPDIADKRIEHLTEEEKQILWFGKGKTKGVYKILKENEKLSFLYYTYYNNVEKLKSHIKCYDCKGSRLRKEALYVKILGKTIADFVEMPIDELLNYFQNEVSEKIPHRDAVQKLLNEIVTRLQFLCDVGLPYLTLNREIRTLSGGESQRVYLTTAIGSSLVGSIYILDEPTTGLHPRDTHRLIKALKKLRDNGNTVVVVEHDEEVMKNADLIIDMGPRAGKNGGEVVFQGTYEEMKNASNSLTADYLFGRKNVFTNTFKKTQFDFIYFKNARANNLKGIDIQFPFNAITCITGVSGSGKSSLVEEELLPEIENVVISKHKSSKISGAIDRIRYVNYINQNSVSTSTRSNCATYTGTYDFIRMFFVIYSNLQGIPLTQSHFSFNVDGGRCPKCSGEGIIRIPMQFMADIEMTCDECKGKRFKNEVLQVKFFDKNISDVLEMSIDEAYDLFNKETTHLNIKKELIKNLGILKSVGLGYVPLGQSTSKMSGGELQRLKIATFLQQEKAERSLFILDEPSTGLHFYDIEVLMKALQQLIMKGHTIIIIEHQQDIIKNADWVIDLGPEGGKNGGYLVFQGTVDDLVECEKSITGKFLAQKTTIKS
jgi:excinuclease ABC subunit A